MMYFGLYFGMLRLLFSGVAYGLEITSSGAKSIEKASGDSVKLDCEFTLAPEDSGHLDIDWTIKAADNQNPDKVIILYSGGRVYDDYYPAMKGRIHFSSADQVDGDASVNVTQLETTDTGLYQCMVKKAPGIGSRKIFLSVMVRPSKPQCSKEGLAQEGKDMVLRCLSSEGTLPLTYTWEKISHGKLLPANAMLDSIGGTMTIKNVSVFASGSYRCTVKNRVGTDECVLQMHISPAPNLEVIIGGAVTGALLVIILIAITVLCCRRAHNRRKYEKETAFEIREDVLPPRSRASVAHTVSSQRSSLGSHSHQREYCPRPHYIKVPIEDRGQAIIHTLLSSHHLAKMTVPDLRHSGVPV